MVGPSPHSFLAAEDALRSHQQHEHQHEERRDVLQLRRDLDLADVDQRAHLDEEPDDEAADDARSTLSATARVALPSRDFCSVAATATSTTREMMPVVRSRLVMPTLANSVMFSWLA